MRLELSSVKPDIKVACKNIKLFFSWNVFEEIGQFSLLFLSKKYFSILFILIFNMVNLKR